MKILKVGFGNANEAYIEDSLTDGVNIIFSNDNNKGKTILIQGLMYALGNDPIFPSGFSYKLYYFYTSIEHNGVVYEFLRKNDTIAIKQNSNVIFLNGTSELKYYVTRNIFPLPQIIKDDQQKIVDLSLFYQMFFVGQDKRNPSNTINAGYYNKQDFISMLFAFANCLTLPESLEKLRKSRNDLQKCKSEISTLLRRLVFYQEHPEIASIISKAADRELVEAERQALQSLNDKISEAEKKRTRLTNRKIKLESLLSELNSLNTQLKSGKIYCRDCGSGNVAFNSEDLSFELTNDIVRRNIISSISEASFLYLMQIEELTYEIRQHQIELEEKLKTVPAPMADILIYTETLKSHSEDEQRLSNLQDKKDLIEAEIKSEERNQKSNSELQAEVKRTILANMNSFYKLIDPDGTQEFKDFFATRNMTFSGSDEQEYYFSRTLAIFWYFRHDFPIIMDCFRQGELSTKKENTMIDEYKKTGRQVIITSTLKDEEYDSGTKYYSIPDVNAINYETIPYSHILQSQFSKSFMQIIDTFGVVY